MEFVKTSTLRTDWNFFPLNFKTLVGSLKADFIKTIEVILKISSKKWTWPVFFFPIL
jgi:hypothetical protein